MAVVDIKIDSNGTLYNGVYEYDYNKTLTAASDEINVLGLKKVTFGVDATSGTAKMQYTIGALDKVIATAAIWKDVPGGGVSGTYFDVTNSGMLTAVRVIDVTGTVKMFIKGAA